MPGASGTTVGKLEAIWLKRFKRGPMDALDSVEVVAGRGLLGNANQGGRRQVTLIEQEVWNEMMRALGASLPPSARRANLVISGCPLRESRGRELRIGPAVLRIAGETKPCEVVEAAWPGLSGVMYPNWRGGAFGQVLVGGSIQVGDEVHWLPTSRGDGLAV
ncbi:MAG TPA: MOSC domain-containing protein [Thermoanaerobaculia bacterium]|nr:MOSC domain-containing protein [Thermoanaerobaculia bacterium]